MITKSKAIFYHKDGEDIKYGMVSDDEETLKKFAKHRDAAYEVEIHKGHSSEINACNGYAFRTPSGKIIPESIYRTPSETRLHGGEGKVYPVHVKYTRHIWTAMRKERRT